jgi:hypothetical protein
MRLTSFVAFVLLSLPATVQSAVPPRDFCLILERIGCLGSCPDYKVTILSDGSVQYEGRSYVHVQGIRKRKIPLALVQKLTQKLQEQDFFHWEEKKSVCLDFPETHITATLNGVSKHVVEGCNEPGKILELANEIEKIAGVKRWI